MEKQGERHDPFVRSYSRRGLLAAGLAGVAGLSWLASPRRARTDPRGSAVLESVAEQFRTMTATRYQHHSQEDAGAGTYFYDCVGLTSYTLRLAAPNALKAVLDRFQIRRGYVPTPSHYTQWFLELESRSSDFWIAVPRLSDVRTGDLLAWNVHPVDPQTPGHSVIAAGIPVPISNGSFSLLVYDSTSTPHGPDDTRITDARNQPGPNGRPSGLGMGTLELFAAEDGRPNAVAWSVGAAPRPQVIGIARALS
jgi:hypothetical protein